MENKTKRIILEISTIAGGISAITALIIALFSDTNKALIALAAIIISLVVLLASAWHVLNRFIKKEHPKEYIKLSQFMRYECSSNTHGVFDEYRLIQSKRPVLSSVDFGFDWTGSNPPVISSQLQKCDGKIYKTPQNEYDKVILKLTNPLLYNEATVIHVHAETDDIDGKAKPFLYTKIDEPSSLVSFSVVLTYKESNTHEQAELQRKKIDGSNATEFETIKTIEFNPNTKSYNYILADPEVGYFYRLKWTK